MKAARAPAVGAWASTALVLLAVAPTPAGARPLDEIRRRGVIELCAPANAMPFGSRKAASRGINVDLAQAIADRLGARLQIDWVTQAGQYYTVDCDLVVGVIAEPSTFGELYLRLSIPYQRGGVALALALQPALTGVTGFADLPKGARVAVQAGSLAQMLLGKRGLKIIPFGFEDDMVEAVAKGEVEAAAVTAASVGWYQRQHPEAPVRLVDAADGEAELDWNLAVGMRRADSFLRREVDTVLRAMLRDGTVARIHADYGVRHLPPSPRAGEPRTNAQ